MQIKKLGSDTAVQEMKEMREASREGERESQRNGFFFSIKKVIGKLQCYPMYWVAL
jgi:hypothetical protein